MKTLQYKTRIILFNLIIFAITILIVLFVALQSCWYFSIEALKNDMLQSVNDLNLYVQENTAQLKTDDDQRSYWYENSSGIYTAASTFIPFQLELFDTSGEQLAPSNTSNDEVNFQEQFESIINNQNPVIYIGRFNGAHQLHMLASITTNKQDVIGYVGLSSNLKKAYELQVFIFSVLGVGMLIGLIILFICISYFSNSFVKPIRKLTKISGEINKGEYDRVIQYKKKDEIGDLVDIYNEMTQSINSVIVQLKSERQRLGSVLASLDEGLLALNQNGEVITSNRFIGTYLDVVNPKTIQDFSDLPFFADIFKSLKSGKTSISQEVDCNGRILLITGSPIKHKDTIQNYLIIIRNVTTARTLEKEQRKFISSISHELRTPLTTIIGYTDMLSRRKVDDPKLLSKSLDTINREGHRLVRLVDDLLNANSVENMVFSIVKEKISLENLLTRVVEQMRIKSWEKEIEIAFKAQSDLPEIYGDYDRLSQTFINIIHNAIKFSPRGGIIDVVLTQEDERNLSVSIRDYGTGIDPAKKDFIFSAFYRVDEDRARSEGEGGAGLGLYLVKQVVEKHDGTIHVDSEVEEGTNITVILPLPQEEEDKEKEESVPETSDDFEKKAEKQ